MYDVDVLNVKRVRCTSSMYNNNEELRHRYTIPVDVQHQYLRTTEMIE